VEVREALRIDADWDDRMWEPDRHVLIASGFLPLGIEHRHLRDERYAGDTDYRADTHVFRDDRWIGQIKVSTSTLGSSLSVPGGQIARWQSVIDALLVSLTIRASPPASEALEELRVSLPFDDLNPRFVGDQLILSLAPPTTPYEASGVTGSFISLPQLSLLPRGRAEELEQITNAAFAIYQGMPGARVIAGSHCRAVALRENRLTDGDDAVFATTVMAFGRTRQVKLTAFYHAGDRDRMLDALERVVFSLSLPDSR
jgi:hypothetical protein